MPADSTQLPSSLMQYLPAIYQDDPFLGQFLLAFEKILLGREDGVALPQPGLEHTIANISGYLDPLRAPEAFLPWLSSWTAFTLRADLDLAKQREFLANIIPLFRWRGTKKHLQELLKIFTISVPDIVESPDRPHHFSVTIALPPQLNTAVVTRQVAIANALIVMAKPAHTSFELKIDFPTMVVGKSRVGLDTLLGTGHQEK